MSPFPLFLAGLASPFPQVKERAGCAHKMAVPRGRPFSALAADIFADVQRGNCHEAARKVALGARRRRGSHIFRLAAETKGEILSPLETLCRLETALRVFWGGCGAGKQAGGGDLLLRGGGRGQQDGKNGREIVF